MPRVVTLAPAPALAPFVDWFGWYAEPLADAREIAVPTGTSQLVVNLDEDELRWYDGAGTAHRRAGAGLCTAVGGPVVIDTAEQRHTICVAFRPAGAYPFFGPPADALDEPVVSLVDLWGPGAAGVRDRLLSAPTPHAALLALQDELVARAPRPLERDRGIASAAGALGRGAAVAEVSDRLGRTTGWLRRRFAEQVGLSPKRYGRIRRLHRLLDGVLAVPDPDWSRAAADSGYFDQSHMVNDFRALTGVTPAAYRPRSPGERNHVPLTRRPPTPRSAPR
jgi:AraC-like DNA-binding protein